MTEETKDVLTWYGFFSIVPMVYWILFYIFYETTPGPIASDFRPSHWRGASDFVSQVLGFLLILVIPISAFSIWLLVIDPILRLCENIKDICEDYFFEKKIKKIQKIVDKSPCTNGCQCPNPICETNRQIWALLDETEKQDLYESSCRRSGTNN